MQSVATQYTPDHILLLLFLLTEDLIDLVAFMMNEEFDWFNKANIFCLWYFQYVVVINRRAFTNLDIIFI